MDKETIYVFDGGEDGNPSLQRPHRLSDEQKWESHHVSKLQVIHCPHGRGVHCRVGGQNRYAYTLVPRHRSLGLLKDDLCPKNLINACREAINVKGTPTKRGCCKLFSSKPYAGDIGATALRTGGVSQMSKSARDMDPSLYNVLFKYTQGLEGLTEEASEFEVVRRIKDAKEFIGFQTMCSSDGSKTAAWTSALAAGVDIHASCHKDRDCFASVVTAHQIDAAYDEKDRVIVYFCFPRLGHAVPLKPGKL